MTRSCQALTEIVDVGLQFGIVVYAVLRKYDPMETPSLLDFLGLGYDREIALAGDRVDGATGQQEQAGQEQAGQKFHEVIMGLGRPESRQKKGCRGTLFGNCSKPQDLP